MANSKYGKTSERAQKAARSAKSVVIPQPKQEIICLEIIGTASMIQNNFSQKAIEQLLRKHMGLSQQREAKKPRECIEQAKILNTDGAVCIPCEAIKAAMLSAHVEKKPPKTQLRTSMFILGGSIPIAYQEMVPRMDMVRTAGIGRTPDVRFRPEYVGWSGRLRILHNPDIQNVQSVVDLLQRAGCVGVGEWRPERNGVFGTFRVSRAITDPKELDEVEKVCAAPRIRPVIPEWAMDVEIDPELLKRIAAGEKGEDAPDDADLDSSRLSREELDEDVEKVMRRRGRKGKAA